MLTFQISNKKEISCRNIKILIIQEFEKKNNNLQSSTIASGRNSCNCTTDENCFAIKVQNTKDTEEIVFQLVFK